MSRKDVGYPVVAGLSSLLRRMAGEREVRMARGAALAALVALSMTAQPCAGFAGVGPVLAGRRALRAPQSRPTSDIVRRRAPAVMMLPVDSLALAKAAESLAAAPGVAYAWYLGALATNDLAVDTATASLLYTLGVLTESAITGKAHSARYLAIWATLGVADGVVTHAWYGFLQSRADDLAQQLVSVADGVLTYPGQLPEGVGMTLVSNTLFTPVYCTGFLLLLSLLEGKSWDRSVERVRLDVEALFWKATKVWGLTNLMLFSFVPLDVRTGISMGIHYVFLVAVALWNTAAVEGRKSGASAGPEPAEKGSSSEMLNLRVANAYYAVDDRLRPDGSDSSAQASPPDA